MVTRRWKFASQVWELGEFPRLMGILNVTPDSFSDGGNWIGVDAAVEHGRALAGQGADVIDVGGESTRPGAEPVTASEEIRRVIPVIERLSKLVDVPISIDTMKAEVAREAMTAGATIVNDITAMTFDPDMARVVAQSDCGVILMHMQGTPQTMQLDPRYDNAVGEISSYLDERVRAAQQAGIDPERIVLDPGIGFGKTAEHNVAILQNIAAFRASGRPVLIGHSRKGFLSKILGRPVQDRLAATIGVSIAAAHQRADLLRIHDVAAVRDALQAWRVGLGSDLPSSETEQA